MIAQLQSVTDDANRCDQGNFVTGQWIGIEPDIDQSSLRFALGLFASDSPVKF